LSIAAAGLFLLPSVVLADSLSPSSVTATIGVGESVTINKTLTVTQTPTTSLVDVFFLADTTGSMSGSLSAVAAGASSIMSGTSGLGSVNYAVGEYKDNGDTYVYRLNTAMTGNTAAVQTGINAWSAGGGNDWPEANLYALQQASATAGWRAGSSRIMVWFGDAYGHDPSGPTSVTEAQATAALVAQKVKVQAIDVGTTSDGLNATGQAGRIATATGGAYFSGINAGSIVQTIKDAITAVINKYGKVSLDLSEVPAGLTATVNPLSITGAFDRSIDRTFNFDVTITGAADGTYSFNIYGLVDDGRVATEADRITVAGGGTEVPEPSTMLLFGAGLAALAGLRRKLGRKE
jgi:hypothetical protein